MTAMLDDEVADLRRANAELHQRLDEALAREVATAEVLQVINSSLGDLTPVFDAMLDKATRLCEAAQGQLYTYDGKAFRAVAVHGVSNFADWYQRLDLVPAPGATLDKILGGEPIVHLVDATDTEAYRSSPQYRRMVDSSGARSALTVALRTNDRLLGAVNVNRPEVRPFTDKQIALLQNFAQQAVIAMENARLLTETREALEQQTAAAEVLQVINSSPGDLTPVFDAMLDKAMRLCEAVCGGLFTYDGERFHTVATRGVPAAMARFREKNPPTERLGGHVKRLLETRRPVHVLDWMQEEAYRSGDIDASALVDLGGARTNILVPLLKDETWLVFSASTARKFGHSRTSRSRCCKTSPRRRSLQWRTHGY